MYTTGPLAAQGTWPLACCRRSLLNQRCCAKSSEFLAGLLKPGDTYYPSEVVTFQADRFSADHFRRVTQKSRRASLVWMIPKFRVSQVTAAEGVT